MIKDIDIPQVKNVTLAVAREKNLTQDEWRVYLINSNDVDIENTLVASKGYGHKEGEEQKTSILRHFCKPCQHTVRRWSSLLTRRSSILTMSIG